MILFLTFVSLALGFLALLPLFIVLVGQYPGGLIAKLNCFFGDYDGVLTSLGTIFLVSGLALLTTYLANKSADRRETLTNKSADRRETNNQKIQSELKLSEFRQKWIDALREDMAKLISISTFAASQDPHTDGRKKAVMDMKEIDSRVRLRLNPHEDAAQEIDKAMVGLVDKVEIGSNARELYEVREQFAYLSTIYLKNEWDTLKKNLDSIHEKMDDA